MSLLRVILPILAVVSVGACDDSGPTDPGIPEWDGRFEVDAPDPVSLTPCPDGWAEVAPDSENGVATCEPWPDGHPVALPVLTPCPAGWREIDAAEEHGVATCEPWPDAAGARDCGDDEAHFPGEADCSRIGRACPAGRWADDLPTDGTTIIYVASGEPAGGAGTEVAPYGSIAEAMSAAGADTIIALSRGTFDEPVVARRDVTLWGACTAETEVTTLGGRDATIFIDQPNVVLRNLRISGAHEGIAARDGGSVEIHDVIVDGAASTGVSIQRDARLTGSSLVVRATGSVAPSTRGYGLDVRYGGHVDMERVVLEENLECGLRVLGEGTVAELTILAIRGTRSNGGDVWVRGATVEQGASLTASNMVVEDNDTMGLYVGEIGASLTLTDVVVRDTLSSADGTRGFGLFVYAGASAAVTRALVERNRTQSVFAEGAGSTLSLVDVVLRDTLSQERERAGGHGLRVLEGGAVDLVRGLLARNRVASLFAEGEGSELHMQDVVVRDTLPQEQNNGTGRGLQVENGATVEMTSAVLENNIENGVSVQSGSSLRMSETVIRDTVSPESTHDLGCGLYVDTTAVVEVDVALFEGNLDAGVYVLDEGSLVTLRDVVVRHTESRDSDGRGGEGATINGGAELDATRTLFDENREAGIYVGQEARAALEDVLVRGTAGRREDLTFGRGLQIQSGSVVTGRRVGVFGNAGAGIMAAESGTSVDLEHVVVRDTRQRDCRPLCEDGFGTGVVSAGAAQVALDTFLIAGNAMCGLQIVFGTAPGGTPFDRSGTVDLHMGEVADNEVCGANVQVIDFDLDRLTDSVIYHDNGRNLDTTALPVPDTATALAP